MGPTGCGHAHRGGEGLRAQAERQKNKAVICPRSQEERPKLVGSKEAEGSESSRAGQNRGTLLRGWAALEGPPGAQPGWISPSKWGSPSHQPCRWIRPFFLDGGSPLCNKQPFSSKRPFSGKRLFIGQHDQGPKAESGLGKGRSGQPGAREALGTAGRAPAESTQGSKDPNAMALLPLWGVPSLWMCNSQGAGGLRGAGGPRGNQVKEGCDSNPRQHWG